MVVNIKAYIDINRDSGAIQDFNLTGKNLCHHLYSNRNWCRSSLCNDL